MSYAPIKQILIQKKENLKAFIRELANFFANKNSSKDAFISCLILHIVKEKAKHKKLK